MDYEPNELNTPEEGFIVPQEPGRAEVPQNPAPDRRRARAVFSRLGLCIAFIMPVATVADILLIAVLDHFISGWRAWPYSIWLIGFGTLYLVGIPLAVLLARRMPTLPPEKSPMTAGRYLCIILICVFMMQAGNMVGLLVQQVMGAVTGVMPDNPIEAYATDESLMLRVVFLVILAPLIEEFIFRKTLIDRMRPYGEKLAVVTSALMFGLFHGNLSQMFYAVSLGLVFGWVYLRTGRLRYTIGLHMLFNLVGGVLSVELLKWVDPNLDILEQMNDPSAIIENSGAITPALIVYVLYAMLLMGGAVAGLVLLIVKGRRVRFAPMPLELPRGKRFSTAWINVGMILFVCICLLSVVSTYVDISSYLLRIINRLSF
ncbi:MAG: CPBP family intramembrane metalloprotease [Oscillospiraceae bacterium]|nr:CPBP family intramembrane metalloprotease [Oscillospiraceae bacterium]